MKNGTLSTRLAEALADADLKPADLARLADTTDATISNWLKGTALVEHVKAINLFRIAEVLRVSPQWLLLGEGSKSAAAGPIAGPAQSSQPVKPEVLTIAMELTSEALEGRGRELPLPKRAQLLAAIYELLEDGVPEAKVLRFARSAAA